MPSKPKPNALDALLQRGIDRTEHEHVKRWLRALLESGERAQGSTTPAAALAKAKLGEGPK